MDIALYSLEKMSLFAALAVVLIAIAFAYCLVPAIGFGAGGIMKGSFAAWLMSANAPTATGSVVATLQSLGAAGLGLAGGLFVMVLFFLLLL